MLGTELRFSRRAANVLTEFSPVPRIILTGCQWRCIFFLFLFFIYFVYVCEGVLTPAYECVNPEINSKCFLVLSTLVLSQVPHEHAFTISVRLAGWWSPGSSCPCLPVLMLQVCIQLDSKCPFPLCHPSASALLLFLLQLGWFSVVTQKGHQNNVESLCKVTAEISYLMFAFQVFHISIHNFP